MPNWFDDPEYMESLRRQALEQEKRMLDAQKKQITDQIIRMKAVLVLYESCLGKFAQGLDLGPSIASSTLKRGEDILTGKCDV